VKTVKAKPKKTTTLCIRRPSQRGVAVQAAWFRSDLEVHSWGEATVGSKNKVVIGLVGGQLPSLRSCFLAAAAAASAASYAYLLRLLPPDPPAVPPGCRPPCSGSISSVK